LGLARNLRYYVRQMSKITELFDDSTSTLETNVKKAEPDRILVLRIGKLLQATRKHLGLNQTAVAPQLGLDQSALSRVESGKQMLTATQWFTFCSLAGISPDALTFGVIELDRPESAIRLPARYAFEKRSKVRSLLPMLEYARNSLGERGFNAFLEDHKLDTDFFVNLNAEINFNFTLDLAEALVKKTGMSPKDAELITRTAGEASAHGALHHYYDYIFSNQINLISGYVENASRYGSNFKYEVVEIGKSQIDVAVTPLAHMREFNYRENQALGDFFAHYDKGFFQNFSAYGGQKPLKVTVLENLYKGSTRCLYRMKAAGR
jgi:transcriptional regulator with XRE-family HTH domain